MTTTTNGGRSQGRVAEHVDGMIQSANGRGVHWTPERLNPAASQ